jgi:GPI ethanolamine phosphate transferase 2/3 subunit F
MRSEATQISAFTAAAAHALCFAGLAAGRGALVADPERALRLLVVLSLPFPVPSPAATAHFSSASTPFHLL